MSETIKQAIIQNIQGTYCRLARSKTHGVGVVAIRDIPVNEDPFGELPSDEWVDIKLSEFGDMDEEILRMVDDFFSLQEDGTISFPRYGLNGMNISFFMNRSADPNVRTVDNGSNFRTTRNIKKGEELLTEYADYDAKWGGLILDNNF